MNRHGTPIEWTHIPGYIGETWNPVAGCSLVSPGCTHCYAMQMAWRHKLMMEASTGNPSASPYYGTTKVVNGKPVWTGVVNTVESAMLKPLQWKKPRAIFVNSMSDLFHPQVPFEYIDRVFAVAALCPQHIFIILTKRSDIMRDWCRTARVRAPGFVEQAIGISSKMPGLSEKRRLQIACDLGHPYPLPNVWLGVSCEDQQRADERIPDLLATPAAVRLVSAEPLLGLIDFGWHVHHHPDNDLSTAEARATIGAIVRAAMKKLGPTIDWVIAGGESGRDARPMHPDWVRSIRNQCALAGVPFFFKQWGEYGPCELYPPRTAPYSVVTSKGRHLTGMATIAGDPEDDRAEIIARFGKRLAGHLLDGQTYQQFPIVRTAA